METVRTIIAEQRAICLVALCLLSLVLPLWTGKIAATRGFRVSNWKRVVWTGQIAMAACGLVMITLPAYAFAAFGCSLVILGAVKIWLSRHVQKGALEPA